MISNEPPRGVGLEAFLAHDGAGLDAYMKLMENELFPNMYYEGKLHLAAIQETPGGKCKYSRQSGESMASYWNGELH